MIDFQDISILDYVKNDYKNISIVEQNDNTFTPYVIAYEVKQPKKPIITEPQTTTISPIVQVCVNKLKNGTPLEQKKYMGIIAQSIDNPKIAPQFLDNQISEALFFIINQDTSKMKKPTFTQKRLRKKLENGKKLSQKEYEKAYSLSDKEIADRNKILAIALIAQSQNIIYKELAKRSNIKPTFQELPSSAKIVDLLNNPNNDVKAAAIGALYMMYRPEYKNELMPIFENASKSQIPEVKDFALQALQEINSRK